MQIISFIAVILFATLWSVITYAAETIVCDNYFPESAFIDRTTPTGSELATTSVILNIAENKITKVTYVHKHFLNGKIHQTNKNDLVCNIPDVEDTDLECLQDNLAVYSETGAVSTPDYS